MRPGPPRGATATLEVTVPSGVSTAGAAVVYDTATLAADTERVCRSLLAPHLEPGEIAIGVRMELLHRAPVPAGATVSLQATVASVGPNTLVCEMMARHAGAIVARGSFEQRTLPSAAFDAEVAARTA